MLKELLKVLSGFSKVKSEKSVGFSPEDWEVCHFRRIFFRLSRVCISPTVFQPAHAAAHSDPVVVRPVKDASVVLKTRLSQKVV